MFNEPTVFILGAGASWHYGYPTGEELVKRVIERSRDLGFFCEESIGGTNSVLPEYVKNRISGPSTPGRAYEEIWELIRQECKDLEERLKHVNPPVIDYFLGQNPTLQDIGKLIIPLVILECEAMYLQMPGNINRRKSIQNSTRFSEKERARDVDITAYHDDWCRFILYQLVSNCPTSEELLLNKVTFITFNYDISLEYKLYTGLRSIEQFQEHAGKFFEKTRILHMYGKVGNFPGSELTPLNFEALPAAGNVPDKYRSNRQQQYSEFKNLLDAVYRASCNLRVISDHKGQDGAVIKFASYDIQKVETVYILGYGFDETNSELLELSTHLKFNNGKYRRVFFTNFEDRNSVNKKASKLFSDGPEMFLANSIWGPKAFGYFEKSTRNVYDALERDFEL